MFALDACNSLICSTLGVVATGSENRVRGRGEIVAPFISLKKNDVNGGDRKFTPWTSLLGGGEGFGASDCGYR